MLEVMLRQEFEKCCSDQHQVTSAGVAAIPGAAASANAITVMKERGLDLTGHRSRAVQDLNLADIDVFWCMGGNHALYLVEAGVAVDTVRILNEAGGGVPDPYGGDVMIYERCATVLAGEAHRIVVECCPPSHD